MRDTFLPFSRPDISEAEISAVAEVLRSGWITTGSKTAEFEERFADYTGCGGAVAVASGTGGMHVLFGAMDIGPGDEVVTPSITWVSTVNLIVLRGAHPVFVDADRDTMLASPEAYREAITERTKAVVPVHYAGAAADMGAIRELATDAGIAVIEDAAHAVGTEYRGMKIGATGTSVFSFHPIKNITTGEGGMVCSDDEKLLERVRRLKFHGLGVDAFDRETQGRSPQAEVLEPGYKYNLTDIAAVLGLGQLSRVDDFNRSRTELATYYRSRLEEIDEVLPLSDPSWPSTHSWHLFVIRLDTDRAGMDRDHFMAELKRRNIGTGIHFKAVHLQRYYREVMGCRPGMLPHSEWNSDRICSLPLFPQMTEDDVDSVIDAIKEVLHR